MKLNDEELILLEQLTYIGDIKGVKKVKYKKQQSVKKFLKPYVKKIKKIDNDKTINGAQMDGHEWASIIRYIYKSKKLSKLIMKGKMYSKKEFYAIDFREKEDSKQAYVAFKGTLNIEEWEDNMGGLCVSDTKCQREALQYINGLKYDDITVVGHSKGGNKAMYVSFLSDKVKRCVTLDAQGFSEYFYDKYWMEVKKKRKIITQYAVADDFVNILLFQPPGVKTHYLKGYGMENIDQAHSPNSPLQFNSKGEVGLKIAKQNKSLKLFHGLSSFISNVMPLKEKKELAPYLGKMVGLLCSGSGKVSYKGVDYFSNPNKNQKGVFELIGTEPRLLAKTLAYVLKYISEYKIDSKEIDDLLGFIGLKKKSLKYLSALGVKRIFAAGGILALLNPLSIPTEIAAIKLGKNILEDEVYKVVNELFNKCGIDYNQFMQLLGEEYNSIPSFNHNTANLNVSITTEKTLDFSKKVYEEIMEAIDAMPKPVYDYNWSKYASEDWYDERGVGKASSDIEVYYDDFEDCNKQCKRKVNEVFESELECYAQHGKAIQKLAEKLAKTRRELQAIKDSIAV